jgi:hypothetical protein
LPDAVILGDETDSHFIPIVRLLVVEALRALRRIVSRNRKAPPRSYG